MWTYHINSNELDLVNGVNKSHFKVRWVWKFYFHLSEKDINWTITTNRTVPFRRKPLWGNKLNKQKLNIENLLPFGTQSRVFLCLRIRRIREFPFFRLRPEFGWSSAWHFYGEIYFYHLIWNARLGLLNGWMWAWSSFETSIDWTNERTWSTWPIVVGEPNELESFWKNQHFKLPELSPLNQQKNMKISFRQMLSADCISDSTFRVL